MPAYGCKDPPPEGGDDEKRAKELREGELQRGQRASQSIEKEAVK